MDTTAIVVCGLAGSYVLWFILDQLLRKITANPYFAYDDNSLMQTLREYIYHCWDDSNPDLKNLSEFVSSFDSYSQGILSKYKVSGIADQVKKCPEAANYLYTLYKKEYRSLGLEFDLKTSKNMPS